MRLAVSINDRCTLNRDDRRPMVRPIGRCPLRPIVRALVVSCDRAYDQSWHPKTDCTIIRGVQRSIARSIVASYDRSYDQNVATYDRSYDQSWHQSIWNRSLDILNMTIVLATTDFAVAITHDLCDQSYVLSKMCPRFQHFRLQVGPRS